MNMNMKHDEENYGEAAALIPGLPDDVAERCLLHLPFLYHRLFRSVSSTWNRFLSDPSFLHSKSIHFPSLTSLSFPFLFAFAFHPITRRIQWQALDPFSRRWFLLPDMPTNFDHRLAAPAFAVASMPRRGEIYVMDSNQTLLTYNATSNSWAKAPAGGGFVAAAAAVGGRVIAAAEDGTAELYDPDAGRWSPAAARRSAVARYDAAAVGGRLYVTEGWTWPFELSPRGAVYDVETDAWSEMAKGMREGWTGSSAVVGGNMYIVAEYGEGRVKRYDEGRDEWRMVAGSGVPPSVRRPYAVAGDGEPEGRRIYVVGSGLDVAVGTVVKDGGASEERVEWEVVKGPASFDGLTPCNAQVLYL